MYVGRALEKELNGILIKILIKIKSLKKKCADQKKVSKKNLGKGQNPPRGCFIQRPPAANPNPPRGCFIQRPPAANPNLRPAPSLNCLPPYPQAGYA